MTSRATQQNKTSTNHTWLITLFISTLVFSTVCSARDWSKLSSSKQTRLGLYFTSTEAFQYKQQHPDDSLFVDTRTAAELNYLGAATVMDAHVPLYFMDSKHWNILKGHYRRKKNKNFTDDIARWISRKGLDKNSPIILMCRSGKRSASAVNILAKAGYKQVYTVVDGFEGDKSKHGEHKGQRIVNGWKNAGLPWSYSLSQSKMYIQH